MSNTSVVGEYIKPVKQLYRTNLQKNIQQTEQLWAALEEGLRSNESIRQFIELDSKGHTFKEKFQFRLSEENRQLEAQILSVSRIQSVFTCYNAVSSEGFDWDRHIRGQVINDYANFIAKPHQWLLPCELAIMARAFNKTIHYYTIYSSKKPPETFNPGQQESVTVVFNGTDHYERGLSQPVAASIGSTSTVSSLLPQPQ